MAHPNQLFGDSLRTATWKLPSLRYVPSELFYRLNVFPIRMHSARTQEDILVAEYFPNRYAKESGKEHLAGKQKELELLHRTLAGNILELRTSSSDRNVCEQKFLSRVSCFGDSLLQASRKATELSESLRPREREIRLPCAKANRCPTISAAAKLGLPGSTLEIEDQSLKINKKRFRTQKSSADRI